jgi:hypothetical protein
MKDKERDPGALVEYIHNLALAIANISRSTPQRNGRENRDKRPHLLGMLV